MVADGSAVVFVRAEDIDRVLEAAELIAGREALMAQALREGKPITEVMGASYEHMLEGTGDSPHGRSDSASSPARSAPTRSCSSGCGRCRCPT